MNGKQLKNSILQWAIQGKLVPQDPNDEPASVLLERIREEKARLVKEGKIKKDKNESIIFRGDDNSHYEKFADGTVKCIDNEIPFEIPQSWCWARMSSVLDVRDGTHDTPSYVSSGYPLITGKDFYNGYFDLSKTQYISTPDYEIINQRSKVDVGDILFSMIGGNIGSQILITEDNYFEMAIKNVALFKHYAKGMINELYLSYFLQSRVVDFKSIASGGAQSFVSLKQLRNYLIPIPSYHEQVCIVSKINGIMQIVEKYEKSQDALDKLNAEIFDKLKKSVLQEAIQGKLVPQDTNDEPASILLERIKEEKAKLFKDGKLKKKDLVDSVIFKGDDNKYYEQIGKEVVDISEDIPFEIPESWSWIRLSNICSICTGATFKKEDATKNQSGVRFLRGGNILPFRICIKDDDIFIPRDAVKDNILLRQNDIVTPAVTSLENIGKMARIESDMPKTTVGGFVFILRPYLNDGIWSEYLLSVMNAPATVEFMRSITNKSGQAFYNIGKERLSTTLIPVPPHMEQKRIIESIQHLFSKLR